MQQSVLGLFFQEGRKSKEETEESERQMHMKRTHYLLNKLPSTRPLRCSIRSPSSILKKKNSWISQKRKASAAEKKRKFRFHVCKKWETFSVDAKRRESSNKRLKDVNVRDLLTPFSELWNRNVEFTFLKGKSCLVNNTQWAAVIGG